MYRILAGGVEIYNDANTTDSNKLINPTLDLEDSTAGSLRMTMPLGNAGYPIVERLTTDITIEKNGTEFWWGRVLSEERDFWNDRVFTCEGALAFFNDVCQPLFEYIDISVQQYLTGLINNYNDKAPANRQFAVGLVTVQPVQTLDKYVTNYETTMECLSKLVEKDGGHLRVRKQNGTFYLDYLADYPYTSGQVIQFGTNLLDFTRKWKGDEFVTVIIPLGARLEESTYEDVDERLTIASVNSGSIYLSSVNAVAQFGWIEKVVMFDDIDDPYMLFTLADNYLRDLQFDNLELEVTAVDLNMVNHAYDSFKLLDKVRVISSPHGLDKLFPIRKMSIPLDSPENTKFTLGENQNTSLTSVSSQINQSMIDKINDMPSKQSVLDAAKENATSIMNQATTGYITIHQTNDGTDAIYISDSPDYTQSQKLWKWNANGLAYSNNGGLTWGLAMTMDGSIVADFITSGTINADLITTGSLSASLIRTGVLFGRDVVLTQCMTDFNGTFLTDGGRILFQKEISGGGYMYEGGLYYDNNGAGLYDSSQNRVVLESGEALKLRSGTGMSLEAWTGLYLYSYQGDTQVNSAGDIYLSTGIGHTGYLNNAEIITAANIYNYIPSSSTAIFG